MYLSQQRLLDEKSIRQRLADGKSPIAEFKNAIKHGHEQLMEGFFSGTRATEIVHARSKFIDRILILCWQQFQQQLVNHEPVTLVAVGGYGRGELHPHSDIDLMLLSEKTPSNALHSFNESLYHFLWDIGLNVGYSLRSIRDCVQEAKKDITVATNIMESRYIVGDMQLLEQMQDKTSANKIWPTRKFFTDKLKEQNERHARFNDSAYNLEPNIKEGPGGLRDLQMLGWVSQRHFGVRKFHQLRDQQFLTSEELKSLIRCRNFLWKLRAGLHFLAGRQEDRLLFDYQLELAKRFGYQDGGGRLAVEQLMKRYFLTVKELRFLNEILLQHFQEALLSPRTRRTRKINDRFQIIDGFIEMTSPDVFVKHPPALLEVFIHYQKDEAAKGIRASTIRQIKADISLIDGHFRNNPECQHLFMRILRQPNLITRALRRMNTYGVLGAYIPAFGRIVGQMQHDLFHVYTVDAHSLFVVSNLRRFGLQRFAQELPQANRVMADIEKPERLFLAGLFHDIAKGRGGDHSELGERDALHFCRTQKMDEYDSQLVAWLVRHHLLMSWTAQREDISDAKVINKFAATVGDQEHLDNLYLLTMADIRGTSPKVWNAWKGQLLEDLYLVTSRSLRRGFGQAIALEQRIEKIKSDTRTLIQKKQVLTHLQQHWLDFDDEYFIRHDTNTLAWIGTTLVESHLVDLPLIVGRYHQQTAVTQFLVAAPDSENLLVKVAGGFDLQGLSIADAKIYRLISGLVLMVFVIFNRQGEVLADNQNLVYLADRIRAHIRDPKQETSDNAIVSRAMKHFPIKTHVRFIDPPAGADYSIMEVTAQDRPGLVHRVAKVLLDCKLRLESAKIATFGEKVEDIFFISDRDRKPISDESTRTKIQQQIIRVLDNDTSANRSDAA